MATIKIYSNKSTYDAALERIRWLFDEFPKVVVSFSGGKDSVVVFNLALQVAREKGRLPLTVLFLDQEAEWQSTIDVVTEIMENPDVDPMWMQIPLLLSNATSTVDHWLKCWDPDQEEKWMRPRWHRAYTENVYGTMRFKELFNAISRYHWKGQKVVNLSGVRAEESPGRFLGLTNVPKYKWATWGAKPKWKDSPHWVMHPIYDWSYTDVWKAIHDNGWTYSKLYDQMYAYGVPVRNMRVSNVHHETAINSLFILQEIEGATWEKLTQRIEGIDMAGKMQYENFYYPKQLPYMFKDWFDYRDYLLENLVTNEDWKKGFRLTFSAHDKEYAPVLGAQVAKVHICSILTNDWEQTKIKNWVSNPDMARMRHFIRQGALDDKSSAIEAGV